VTAGNLVWSFVLTSAVATEGWKKGSIERGTVGGIGGFVLHLFDICFDLRYVVVGFDGWIKRALFAMTSFAVTQHLQRIVLPSQLFLAMI
jgi:hypothetical protein